MINKDYINLTIHAMPTSSTESNPFTDAIKEPLDEDVEFAEAGIVNDISTSATLGANDSNTIEIKNKGNNTTTWTTTKTVSVYEPSSIQDYVEQLDKARLACSTVGLVPLYHYTQLDIADSILANGLRMSTQGQGDGGVYLSTLGPCSYGIGTPE